MTFEEFLNTDITISYNGHEETVKGRDFSRADLIDKYLVSNGLYVDEVYRDRFFYACVEISWGDWKHEHLRCDYLMKQIGYSLHHVDETETDGSDCYSAIRYYVTDEMMEAIKAFRKEL